MTFASYSDVIQAVGKCETQEEADNILKLYAADLMAGGISEQEATEIGLENIGYISGYFDSVAKQRILRLFKTEHPIFGKLDPTPSQAFEAGLRLGEAAENNEDLQTVYTEIRRNMEEYGSH